MENIVKMIKECRNLGCVAYRFQVHVMLSQGSHDVRELPGAALAMPSLSS